MILFALLIMAFVIALLLSIFGGRFDMTRPAIVTFLLGLGGSLVFFVALSTPSEDPDAGLPVLAVIAVVAVLISTVLLLSFALLWAYRRWSGFYQEMPDDR